MRSRQRTKLQREASITTRRELVDLAASIKGWGHELGFGAIAMPLST